MTTRREGWFDVAALEDLNARGSAVVRVGGKQLALFGTDRGVFACNNRCPHEGYPLAEGSVDGRCVLTCNWHNWKFELKSGENLFGGDELRTYPTRVIEGRVWVELREPPIEQAHAKARERLLQAIDDDEYDRIAREAARLLRLGATAETILSDAVAHVAPHLEFGMGHAFAALPDWLGLGDESPDEADRLACVVEPLAHMARDGLRQPRFEFADSAQPYSPEALMDAIEREDRASAEALLLGALAQGEEDRELARVLTRSALRHYADFGHSAIYVQKAFEASKCLGPSARTPLLLSLVRSLSYAQRDDLLPEFRGYASALSRFGSGRDAVPGAEDFVELGAEDAMERVVAASAAPPLELHRVLLVAAAVRMLHFDVQWAERWDRPVSDNVGWLDFTHALTFANAVRELCEAEPGAWPAALLQMACFVGRNRRYVSRDLPAPWAQRGPEDVDLDRLRDRVLDHGTREPILSAHGLKTFVAVRRELAHSRDVAVLVVALERFLTTPLKLRHVRRSARQALALVSRED